MLAQQARPCPRKLPLVPSFRNAQRTARLLPILVKTLTPVAQLGGRRKRRGLASFRYALRRNLGSESSGPVRPPCRPLLGAGIACPGRGLPPQPVPSQNPVAPSPDDKSGFPGVMASFAAVASTIVPRILCLALHPQVGARATPSISTADWLPELSRVQGRVAPLSAKLPFQSVPVSK